MRMNSFLPISNIIAIAFENLLNEMFFTKVHALDLRTKVLIAQKVVFFMVFSIFIF